MSTISTNSSICLLKRPRYENTRCALGLQAAPLGAVAKVTHVGPHTQARNPDQQQNDVFVENISAAAGEDETCLPVASKNTLGDNADVDCEMVPATSEQGFDFDDNMDTNAWEWGRFLNLSPVEN